MAMRTNWWDNLVWVILFLFLIPSSLAVAAWGSLPGQRLYQIKLLTERAGGVFAFSNEAQSKLQVALTGKRLDEATQLLTDESSGEGLEYFRKQVEEAKQAIARAPEGDARNQLTLEYLRTLENASRQLEQQKQLISQANGYTPPPPPQEQPVQPVRQANAGVKKPPQQVVVVNQVTQVTQVTQVVRVVNVIQQINQTQDQITSTISQLQSAGAVTPTPTPLPTEAPTPLPTNTPEPTPVPTATVQQQIQTIIDEHPKLLNQNDGENKSSPSIIDNSGSGSVQQP